MVSNRLIAAHKYSKTQHGSSITAMFIYDLSIYYSPPFIYYISLQRQKEEIVHSASIYINFTNLRLLVGLWKLPNVYISK